MKRFWIILLSMLCFGSLCSCGKKQNITEHETENIVDEAQNESTYEDSEESNGIQTNITLTSNGKWILVRR